MSGHTHSSDPNTYWLQYIYQELQYIGVAMNNIEKLKIIELKIKLGADLTKRENDVLEIPNKDMKINGVEL